MLSGSSFRRAARPHEMEGRACEDAALCQASPDGLSMMAALCDGCSSGVDSGLAANLLARSALHAWALSGQAASLARIGRMAWGRAAEALALAGLSAMESPATLLLARARLPAPGESVEQAERAPASPGSFEVELAMWGDGALAACDPSGALMALWSARSELNMPAYPAYAFDGQAWAAYLAHGGSTSWGREDLGSLFEEGGASVSQPLAWDAESRGWAMALSLPAGWSLSLLSDGVGAVEGVEQLDAARVLCAGRGPGGFAERRARKAIDDWGKAGARLGDDISIAAIRFNQGE